MGEDDRVIPGHKATSQPAVRLSSGTSMPRDIDDPPRAELKKRGRQRSEESEEAILKATLCLLKERPLREITIEEIARRAGVGKATIYKWWPSKAYVAMDAFLRKTNRMVPTPDTGSAEKDFKEQLDSLVAFYTSPTGRIFGQFMAEGQSDREFACLFRERFLKPRREVVGVIFDRGVERGEIRQNLDRELVLDMIYGPAILRLMAGHVPLNRVFTDALISALFRGFENPSGRRVRAQARSTNGMP